MWLALNWEGEKEGKWREDWGDKKSYRLFSFCAFPSFSFPFFCTRHVSYCPLSLLPLRFSPTPPFYLCLQRMVTKCCGQVVKKWYPCHQHLPTCTCILVLDTVELPQRPSLYNSHLSNGHFFWPTVYTVNLVSTSLQWPLSSVPKVVVAERFNCNEKKFSDCQLLSLYIMNLHVFM